MATPNTELAGSGATANTPHFWVRLARRERLACGLVLILTLGLRAALLPWLPVPRPTVHDEFSYLLAADTYAHGRLTNPPHPFWQHFETFHVLQQPTYASKYQPLQGLILACGQKLFGEPWVGVYLVTGLMCAAICWMLQGWIAPEWALLGALFCAVRVGVLSYWMNSYFPGAVAGLGGALAMGAIIRIWRRQQFHHALTWAVGLSILALSRPYDAVVLGVSTAALLLYWLLRKSCLPLKTLSLQVALPALLVLGGCAVAIAYNNFRVTGHLLTVPDQVYERQYSVIPMGAFSIFPLWPEPVYRNAPMRALHVGVGVQLWTFARQHPVLLLATKVVILDNFFFPFWGLLIPVMLCPYDLNTPEESATVLLLAAAIVMIAPLVSNQTHYAAVFTGVFYLRFLQTLARLWGWRPRARPVGVAMVILLVGLLGGELCINVFSLIHRGEGRDFASQDHVIQGAAFAAARKNVVEELEKQAGRQLVLVRYTPAHNPHQEWVYNRADVDGSAIVWAREMGEPQDAPFVKYFHDRRLWLLEPDQSPPKLSPYKSEASQ